MLISAWLTAVRSRLQTPQVVKRRQQQKKAASSPESLEIRSLLTAPTLVAVRPNVGDILLEGDTRHVAPRELTLQFNPGQVIDATTLATGIEIWRGGPDKIINNVNGMGDDIAVTNAGIANYYVGIGDLPEEVVIRFAENLPDDVYRITIKGAGADALKNVAGDSFNDGEDDHRNFTLDLGAVVEGVVPQPVIRTKTITIANVAQLADQDKLTITVGGQTRVFEFHDTTSSTVVTGDFQVDFTPGTSTAADVAAALAAQIPTSMGVSVSALGSDVTLLGNDFTPTITETATNATAVQVKDAGLVQRRDTVIVYFNHDALDPIDAENTAFYRLYNTGGTLTTADDTLLQPTSVVYDVVSNTAVLKFAADLPTATYSLKIGSNSEVSDLLVDAIDLGILPLPVEWSGAIGDSVDGSSDVDLFMFEIETNQAVTFVATPSSGMAVAVRLFDDMGAPLQLEDPGSAGAPVTLTSAVLTAGIYYLGISSSGNVAYTPADGLGAVPGSTTGTYTLSSGTLTLSDNNSSFATATQVGVLGATGRTITAAITPQSIALPAYPGGFDEPGHRDIPIGLPGQINGTAEDRVASSGTASTTPGAIAVREYFFGDVYGQDPQGNNLHNAITEIQKQRAREILELWSKQSGIMVRETASSGLQIVTGDLRAFGPSVPPNAAAGMANAGLAIMNGNIDWGQSEYGGAWFNTAIHEIGHSLGLEHAYDSISVMGAGEDPLAAPAAPREAIYPTDIDTVSIRRIHRPDATDIDMYQFQLTEPGTFSAEIVAERQNGTLDSVLRLYDGNKNLISQNDNYFSSDSFIGLNLPAGTYYLGVSSTGNADYDPTISDTGHGGTTDGPYELKLNFAPAKSNQLLDTTGTEFDGDGDGIAGGEYQFWFKSGNTVFVDKLAASGGNGSLATPYNNIAAAITFAESAPGTIVRVVGNGGIDGNEFTAVDNQPYLIGAGLADGGTLEVPKDVTLMIDADAVIKLQDANIDAGTSAQGNDRSNSAIQVLGVPNRPVYLTSYRNDDRGGDSAGVTPAPAGGNWGGIVFRNDSDHEAAGIFLNYVNKANITYGGGQVFVNSVLDVFSPIHMDTARPTVTFNTITDSASAAMSANPNSFDDSLGRIGPEIHGNILIDNSINGLFIRIRTALGQSLDTLDVGARFDDTDIVHVIKENLLITGNPGGALNGVARLSGRLAIDAGTVVKLGGSRIESLIGNGSLIAEGTPERPIIFTSILDDQFGVGGTFDTTNNQLLDTADPGDWGGLVFNATSNGSVDNAVLRYGGGATPIEGDAAEFNVIEVHQANFRISNSRLEFNASGVGPAGASATRNGRGDNGPATIFVRGAQPIIVGNEFRDNSSTGSFVISIDVNSLNSFGRADVGRSTGLVQRVSAYDDNHGALVRNNRMRNNGINGMEVRGGNLTTQVIWDDTDIVHVLQSEVYDPNLHTFGGIRLQSGVTESLVVKLLGSTAGFTAGGVPQDIDDRIGGTVQIIGTPGFPVVLTSLHDDSVGAGFDLDGFPVLDTNNNGTATTPAAGNWRSILLTQYSNDRNVRVINEVELPITAGQEENNNSSLAQLLGTLASRTLPGVIPTTSSAEQLLRSLDKVGDDNRPVGFEVHGHISPDTPSDMDVYSFKATAGSEVWIDLDRTSSRLDSVLELISSTGVVVASSSAGMLSGIALPLIKDTALGGDYYTQNHMDEAFRVVLPGTTGVEGTYFVRVRSHAGLTSGAYQLQVRVNQRDEAPGSTVRFADIRYATNGIEMYGLNAHSPLTGEASESTGGNNDTLGGSEFIGDLLSSDRNTISVSGSLSSASDIDFYSFSVDYEFIQAIGGVNAGGKTWATIFDIDYADGLSRPDTILSVYNAAGQLMFVSRDSDITDDQPAPGAGQDVDDLSRGSVGKLDPFLGTVQLPEANDRRYIVAISSNGRMPAELAQFFIANPADQLSRLEPVNSVLRIVEDHIGYQGYATNGPMGPVPINPIKTQGLFNITSAINLDTYVKPFTLADVSLFSATGGGQLSIRNPFNGTNVVTAVNSADFDDIAVRPDGVLYATINNSGNIRIIDPATGGQSGGGASDIPMASGTPDFGGMAFRLAPEVVSGSYELFVANNNNWNADGDANTGPGGNEAGPALWRLDPTTGNRIDDRPADGLQNVGPLPAGVNITGLAFASMQSSTLFAVDSAGGLWRTTVSGDQTFRSIGAWTPITLTGGAGPTGFTGITLGPQNVEDAMYAAMLFASGSDGRLYAFDQTGELQNVFDTDADGVADDSRVTYQGGTRGLAFSPLDFNLWHPTLRRRNDAGHGTNNALDNSREIGATRNIVGRSTTEGEGGASFYFGLEQWQANPSTANGYYDYNGSGAQLGVLNGQVQRELTTNAAIANTVNLIGGASGALVSNNFSLEGYKATDRPTLYFNYFLHTDGTDILGGQMQDAARVYVSSNGGTSWTLVATNNSVRNGLTSELPTYSSHSATQTPLDARQLVQELFDNTGTWRQARIDLGGFAGASNLQLRFDFTTSVDSTRPARSAANSVEGFYIDDIIVGLAGRGEMATTSNAGNQGGAFFNAPVDPTGNTQQLIGEYQLEIRRGTEFASNVDPLGPQIGINPASLITGKERLVSGWNITVPSASVIQDGDTYTISNGIFSRTFEFDTLGNGATSPNVPVVVNSTMSKGAVANALAAAINGQSGLTFNADPVTWLNVIAATRPASQNSDIVDLTGAYSVTRAAIAAPADLRVNIVPTSIPETQASQSFTISRTGSTAAALTVLVEALSPNPFNGASTQAMLTDEFATITAATAIFVTIPAGQSFITLQLLPTDDNLRDGTQAVLVRASAAGLNSIVDIVDITDDETGLPAGAPLTAPTTGPFGTLRLTLLQTNVNENAGNSGVSGYVTLPDPLLPADIDAYDNANPLTVSITSSDGSEIVSSSTAFVDGQMRAYFAMNVIDEFFAGGNVAVTIYISAPGYTTTTGTVTVNQSGNIGYSQRLGDENLERHQGMVIIESNTIRNASQYGILSDAAPRAEGNQTLAGSVRNLAILNGLRLVPGVTIRNNVVANLGTGGIRFSGDTNAGTQPLAPVPFGKIVNNTIYGGATATGNGIRVDQNASPTLLNNLIVNTGTAISIDGTSTSTVVVSNVFSGNAANGTTGSSALISTGVQMFIDPATNNYYPAPGSPQIDSALNSLGDRPAFLAVKNPLGIPNSDLLAPDYDLFGQLRVDDPGQATPPGLGSNIFKDRGAIERADFAGPYARYVLPADDNGMLDLDAELTRVHVDNLLFPTTLAIDLLDNGIGVDDSKVTSSQFKLSQNGVLLIENVDYRWRYNPSSNRVFFISVTTFPTDTRYSIEIDNSAATGVKDLAGNALAANQIDGTTVFTLLLTDGINDAPVNTAPATVTTSEDIAIVFSMANSNAISIFDKDAYLGRPEATPTFTQDDGILRVTLTVTNGTLTLVDVTGLDFSGGFGDGTDDITMQFTGTIRDINAALVGLQYTPTADYFGAAQLVITSDDLGNFGPPPLDPQTTVTTIDITIDAVNDRPTITAVNPPAVDEDAPAQTISGWATFGAGAVNESGQAALTYTVTNVSNPSMFAVLPAVDAVTGDLTYTLAVDANGSVTFDVTVQDDGGTANGGIDVSLASTFTITVNPINDIPVFTVNNNVSPIDGSGNITTLEDAGLQTINYIATFAAARATATDEISNQTPVWSLSAATTTQGTLAFSQLSVNPATGLITYNTVLDTHGSATFVLTLTDNGSSVAPNVNVATRTVTINVTAVNDAPVARTGNYVVDEEYGLTLDASASTDVDTYFVSGSDNFTDVLSYAWDLDNNGTYETLSGTSPTLVLTWADLANLGITAPNVYTIGLRVTDSSGQPNNVGTTTATLTTLIVDYGDAPDTYGTLKTSNPDDSAAHTIANGLYLGGSVTKEITGQPSPAANLDADDGVTFPTSIETTAGQALPSYVDVVASKAGKLDVWLDLNGSGVFDDATEHLNAGASYNLVAGTNRVNFTVPAGSTVGNSIMRFRFSTAGSALPTGRADDGEVEDYAVQIKELQQPVQPTFLLPIDFNGSAAPIARTTDLTPTISWTLHEENYVYDLVVRNSSSTVVFTVTQQSPTSATVVSNLPAGTYTATLTAFNKANVPALPVVYSFEVVPLVVSSPVGEVTTARPVINWNHVDGTKSYRVVVESLTNGSTFINQVITTASVVTPALPNQLIPTADLPLGQYRVRVQATDAADLLGDWSAYSLFTVRTRPELTAPSSLTNALRPTVTWNPVAGAVSYRVTLSFVTDSGVAPVTAIVSGTSWTPTSNLRLGEYQVKVQAFSSANATGQSSVESLVRTFTVKTPPVSTQPIGRVSDTTPTFSWSAVPGADRYELIVSKAWGDRARVIHWSALTSTLFTQPSELGIGPYTYQIRAINNASAVGAQTVFSSFSPVYSFSIVEPPVVTGPELTTFSNHPTVTWIAPPNSETFDIYYRLVGDPNPEFLRVNGVTGNSYTPNEKLFGIGTYKVWVRTYSNTDDPATPRLSNGSGDERVVSNWSLARTFRVSVPPVLVGPTGRTTAARPSLTWQSVPGALSYEIWINSDSVPVNRLYNEAGLSSLSYTVPADLPVGQYTFWVRARNQFGFDSNWSIPKTFSVTTFPTLTGPSSSTFDTTPTFTWTDMRSTLRGLAAGAARYELQILGVHPTTKLFVELPQYTVTTIPTNTYTIPANMALPAGSYRAIVRAIANGRPSAGVPETVSAFSFALPFNVGGIPIVTPLPSTTNTTPTLLWQAVDGASGYEVFLATSTSPNVNLLNPLNNRTGGTSFVVPQALSKGVYRYWIRAFNASTGAAGAYSAVSTLTIVDAGDAGSDQLQNGPTEFVWTVVPGLIPQTMVTEAAVSMIPAIVDGSQYLPLTDAVSSIAVSEITSNDAEVVMINAEDSIVTEDTDSVLSQWDEQLWWEAQPKAEKPAESNQKISTAGFLGALFAMAPRSIRRRKNDE